MITLLISILLAWPMPDDPNTIGWFMSADPNERAEYMAWYWSNPEYNQQPEEPNLVPEPVIPIDPVWKDVHSLRTQCLAEQWLQKEEIEDELNSVFAPVNFTIPADDILDWVEFQERKAVMTVTIDNWGIARMNLKKIAMLSNDLDGDGDVDLNDLAVESRNWLKGK